jgi:hypothetical protein
MQNINKADESIPTAVTNSNKIQTNGNELVPSSDSKTILEWKQQGFKNTKTHRIAFCQCNPSYRYALLFNPELLNPNNHWFTE